MYEHINPVNYVGFAILGAALLWAVRLVYGTRRGASDDLIRRLMLLAGWILLLAGTIGTIVGLSGTVALILVFGLVIAAITLLIVGLAYLKYMEAERRTLLWALLVAAEKGIPLEQAARAFADERSVQIGPRVSRLAGLLESGVPLPNAMAMTRNALPTDALLAVRLGAETGRMGPALRVSVEHIDHFEGAMRGVLAKFFYVVLVLGIGSSIVGFVMFSIVPVWTQMFAEFDLALPPLTQLNIAASEFFVKAWPLMIPLYGLLFLVFLFAISYYVGWSRYELPVFSRFWLRCDGALVLRSLALAVRQQRELGPTVFMLSRQYPRPSVGKRLAGASAHIDNGIHWCDALRAVGLFKKADVAVLKAAERVGNLAWALDEMADSALRRFAYRLRAGMAICFPLVVLTFGMIVFVIVAGLFLPLVEMIQGLS
ncbi:MAG: type II secretion system F family protein [Planctomycetes bacterium]|nr:type II secretion system F family protein [Planctomycetota bacterium]